MSVSLEAERTLGASYLVLDILTAYVQQKSAWPASWSDLVPISPHAQYSGLDWPADADDIRRRIDLDFTLCVSEVAAMDVEDFTAVRPLGPNYGLHEGRIKQLLQVARGVGAPGPKKRGRGGRAN